MRRSWPRQTHNMRPVLWRFRRTIICNAIPGPSSKVDPAEYSRENRLLDHLRDVHSDRRPRDRCARRELLDQPDSGGAGNLQATLRSVLPPPPESVDGSCPGNHETEVALHFNGLRNEHGRFGFHGELAKIKCPVLMMGGENDPITPISLAEATARSLPSHLVRFERLAQCGHDIHGDD